MEKSIRCVGGGDSGAPLSDREPNGRGQVRPREGGEKCAGREASGTRQSRGGQKARERER